MRTGDDALVEAQDPERDGESLHRPDGRMHQDHSDQSGHDENFDCRRSRSEIGPGDGQVEGFENMAGRIARDEGDRPGRKFLFRNSWDVELLLDLIKRGRQYARRPPRRNLGDQPEQGLRPMLAKPRRVSERLEEPSDVSRSEDRPGHRDGE